LVKRYHPYSTFRRKAYENRLAILLPHEGFWVNIIRVICSSEK